MSHIINLASVRKDLDVAKCWGQNHWGSTSAYIIKEPKRLTMTYHHFSLVQSVWEVIKWSESHVAVL